MKRLFLFVLACVFSACSQKPEKAIQGKWVSDDSHPPVIYGFFADGTVTRAFPASDGSATGSFHFIDHDHLRIDWSGLSRMEDPVIALVHVDHDKLTWKAQDEKVLMFSRLADDAKTAKIYYELSHAPRPTAKPSVSK
jgi:hypothetical protein